MREILSIAWQRFTINTSIVADGQGRFIATLFYFTVLVPFGFGYTLLSDPLRRKNNQAEWLEREPVPTDLESAKEQG